MFSNFIVRKVNSFLVVCPLKRLVLFILMQAASGFIRGGWDSRTHVGNVLSSQVISTERIVAD